MISTKCCVSGNKRFGAPDQLSEKYNICHPDRKHKNILIPGHQPQSSGPGQNSARVTGERQYITSKWENDVNGNALQEKRKSYKIYLFSLVF